MPCNIFGTPAITLGSCMSYSPTNNPLLHSSVPSGWLTYPAAFHMALAAYTGVIDFNLEEPVI